MTEELTEQMKQLVVPLLRENQLELVNIKIGRQGRCFMITIFVDKPDGGITIDECAAINKRIVKKIDEGNLVGDDYVLEVSSPGVDYNKQEGFAHGQ